MRLERVHRLGASLSCRMIAPSMVPSQKSMVAFIILLVQLSPASFDAIRAYDGFIQI